MGELTNRVLFLVAFAVAAVGGVLFLAPIPQPVHYHDFADQRTLLGVPHALNVLSNVPFLLVGVWGCAFLLWRNPFLDSKKGVGNSECKSSRPLFLNRAEWWPYFVLFIGVGLTALGSAYYHLDPNNERLVWDRLPMALAFVSFYTAILAERVHPRVGVWLLGPLVLLGVGSVVNWHQTDDLRMYLVVQFFPILEIPLVVLLFPARYTRGSDVYAVLGWYVVAKLVELTALDRGLFELGGVVSGHTIKHLASAVGAYWILRMLMLRQPV
jgi:hypothetical protein